MFGRAESCSLSSNRFRVPRPTLAWACYAVEKARPRKRGTGHTDLLTPSESHLPPKLALAAIHVAKLLLLAAEHVVDLLLMIAVHVAEGVGHRSRHRRHPEAAGRGRSRGRRLIREHRHQGRGPSAARQGDQRENREQRHHRAAAGRLRQRDVSRHRHGTRHSAWILRGRAELWPRCELRRHHVGRFGSRIEKRQRHPPDCRSAHRQEDAYDRRRRASPSANRRHSTPSRCRSPAQRRTAAATIAARAAGDCGYSRCTAPRIVESGPCQALDKCAKSL